jgi:hypothetical protein
MAAIVFKPKLLSDKYTVTLNILQECLEHSMREHYQGYDISGQNCTKHQELNVLAETLQAYSFSPNAFSTCSPMVMLCLVQDLQNFVLLLIL